MLADPDDTFVGTVNEDWAIESQAGDVFLLGSTSWRIRRVESGVVRVVDAQGAPPSVPFWLGEAPARTAELSREVSELRREVAARTLAGEAGATAWLRVEAGLDEGGALQVVRYLEAGRQALGAMPGLEDVVFERFFDEAGGQQLVIHAPFGARVNRAFGLALRKKFCRSFDFELQAAASDDAIVLSSGPQHGFPLDSVPRMLHSSSALEALQQALLRAPAFQVRWRWNLNRALVVLRWRQGRKVPAQLQRMQSDDLLAAVFPSLAACQENVSGPIEIPDHPVVQETLRDCMTEAADAEGLLTLLRGMESGAVRVHFCDATEPSPLSHEILNGRPYTFLDDAPLEERRTRAVVLRRGLPLEQRDLGQLDAEAVARVREEAGAAPRDLEELHDALVGHVVLRPDPALSAWYESLAKAGRATTLRAAAGPLWAAAESLAAACALFPDAEASPPLQLPAALASRPAPSREDAAALAVRGHLASAGPCTAAELAARTGLGDADVSVALGRLEAEGFALRGRFDAARAAEPGGAEEFCERRLLARIHRYTKERLRREIEPVTAQDLLRFLLRWQHVAPGTQRVGRRGVLAAIEQLQGFECAAGGWEAHVLPARMVEYRPVWLDELCLSGELAWARLGLPEAASADEAMAGPSRATLLGFTVRANLGWCLAAARGEAGVILPSCRRGAPAARLPDSARRALPGRAGSRAWPASSRGRRGALGAGGPRHHHRRRLRQRPGAALGARALVAADRAGRGAAASPARRTGGRLRGALGAAASAGSGPRPRGAGGGGGRAAAGALGRGVPGCRGAGDARAALARGRLGPATPRGPRTRARRALRHRLHRRAVRAARGRRGPARDAAAAAHGRARLGVRRGSAEPGRHPHAGPARTRGADAQHPVRGRPPCARYRRRRAEGRRAAPGRAAALGKRSAQRAAGERRPRPARAAGGAAQASEARSEPQASVGRGPPAQRAVRLRQAKRAASRRRA